MTDDELNANAALAHELHTLLARELLARLKAGNNPPAELLGVARAFLQQCGAYGQPHDDSERRKLRKLWRLYLARLFEAITSAEVPTASMFSEVRFALALNGIQKEAGELVDPIKALGTLTLADLPFKTTPSGNQ